MPYSLQKTHNTLPKKHSIQLVIDKLIPITKWKHNAYVKQSHPTQQPRQSTRTTNDITTVPKIHKTKHTLHIQHPGRYTTHPYTLPDIRTDPTETKKQVKMHIGHKKSLNPTTGAKRNRTKTQIQEIHNGSPRSSYTDKTYRQLPNRSDLRKECRIQSFPDIQTKVHRFKTDITQTHQKKHEITWNIKLQRMRLCRSHNTSIPLIQPL